MGNSGKGIAVLGLILGASGLGFGGFSFYLITTQGNTIQNNVKNTWYREYLSEQTPSDIGYETLINMSQVITVNTGESVYISFNAKCMLDHSTVFEWIRCKIFQDDVEIPEPYAYIGETIPVTSPGGIYMVSLQHSITNLAAGSYFFSIKAQTSDDSFNRIDDTTLFIQTYL